MPQPDHIEAIEKRLWDAADRLRANSNHAGNECFLFVRSQIFLQHAYGRFLAVKDTMETNLPRRGGRTRALSKKDFSQVVIRASDRSPTTSDTTDTVLFSHVLRTSCHREIFFPPHGAVQPHNHPKDLQRHPVILPPMQIPIMFEGSLSPWFELIACLQRYNDACESARDVLVPGLMNREAAV